MQGKYASPKRWLERVALLGLCFSLAAGYAQAEHAPEATQQNTQQWLTRIAQAAQRSNFSGTYVVVQPEELFTLHVLHLNENRTLPENEQISDAAEYELVRRLDGQERRIFRANSSAYAIFPQEQLVIVENQSLVQMFPGLLRGGGQPALVYNMVLQGEERVAGRVASTLSIEPADEWRFGYKVWADMLTGLMLRIQVVDAQGHVLEQVAFTDVKMNVSDEQKNELQTYLQTLQTQGYQFQELQFTSTTAEQEGWALDVPAPGFEVVSCVRRPLTQTSQELMQWVFSDGLASVSIFIEPVNPGVQREQRSYHNGITHSVTLQHDQWWITLVGEVPLKTLQSFAQNLRRIHSVP